MFDNFFTNFPKLAFWGSYSAEPVIKLNNELMAAIASIDPQGYDAATFKVKKGQLLELGTRISEYDRRHTAAKKDFEEASTLNAQRLASIEILQQDLNDPTKTAGKPQIEAAIHEQLQIVSDAQEKLDVLQEKEQAALQTFSALDQAYTAKLKQFENRQQEIDRAREQLALAETRHDMAKEANEARLVLKGMQQSGPDPMDTAVAAIKSKTERLNDETNSLKRMTDGLTPKASASSSIVAEAMARASGTPASGGSVADKLAALKAKQTARQQAA